MKIKHLLIAIASIFSFAGLHGLMAQSHSKAVGDATYYSHRLHGRRTSDGSTYHRDSLTCAHRTLPFGTLLKVRNTKNGREVVVKVTDRGPFRKGGIVDLSYAAAKEIDIIRSGVARVEVEPVKREAPKSCLAEAAKREAQPSVLPQLQFFDPASGNYYTMAEWLQRNKDGHAPAPAAAQRGHQALYMANAKAVKPLWHVAEDKMTAKAAKP